MSAPTTTPRLAPLTDDELSDDQRALLDPLGPRGQMNIFRTMIRHPRLYRQWSGFGGWLLQRSSFEPQVRETIILRAAYRAGATYEWGHHVPLGREAGLSDDEMLAIAGRGELAPDAALLVAAVDEIFDNHCIDDGTWAALAARFDEQQLIELPMLAGHYRLLAGALNSFGVELEDGYPGLGEVALEGDA
jgi:4-carboxymuconolactone decarboxylase